jgi:multiple sugar transport system ATP-binding protein
MADILIKNVKKRYSNGFVAVPKMNLEIHDQEFIVLVGPSGCAKSTTLKMIAGLEEITEGEIYIDKRKVNDLPPKDRDIAMVFQNYALYPHMTVYDNIAFGLKMRKTAKNEIKLRVKEAADILGIQDLLERKPRQLSGGQQQRVALGRTIVRKPKVFLFDEPLSNLDAKLRVQMRTELKRLHEELTATIVYVTHDQVEAMTMGSRIVVMNLGIIQHVGQPLELYYKPLNRFVAGFIGSPAMNFLPCKIVKDGSAMYIETEDFRLMLPESKALEVSRSGELEFTLGMRPEDISIKQNDTVTSPVDYIRASVGVIEPLGKESLLDLTTGKHNLTAVVSSNDTRNLKKEIELAVNLDRIHLFKKNETEEAIF